MKRLKKIIGYATHAFAQEMKSIGGEVEDCSHDGIVPALVEPTTAIQNQPYPN